MPPLLGTGLLHCRVLVIVLPLQEDHAPQQLQLPSMAMSAGKSHALHAYDNISVVSVLRFKENNVMLYAVVLKV